MSPTDAPYVTPSVFDVETASGAYVNLQNPLAEMIRLDDIAWQLATTNRYLGAASRPISVAEHALLVASRLADLGAPAATVLAGLHHDDHEAYMGDIVRAVKTYLNACGTMTARPEYLPLERLAARLDAAIADALELPATPRTTGDIKSVDDWALSAEAYHLLPSRGRGWGVDGLYNDELESHLPAVRRLEFGSSPPHALAAEFRTTHHHWMRLAGAPPQEDPT